MNQPLHLFRRGSGINYDNNLSSQQPQPNEL